MMTACKLASVLRTLLNILPVGGQVHSLTMIFFIKELSSNGIPIPHNRHSRHWELLVRTQTSHQADQPPSCQSRVFPSVRDASNVAKQSTIRNPPGVTGRLRAGRPMRANTPRISTAAGPRVRRARLVRAFRWRFAVAPGAAEEEQ